jgi:putative flippase GtrA
MAYPQCTLLRHEENRGKGRALKTALEYFLSLNNGHVGVVTLDGDGQHAMPDVINCAKALEEHPKRLILGVRTFSGDDVPTRSRMGNNITSFVFRVLCGIPVTDTQTGLRGISAEFGRYLLDVKGERFEFETNMLLETRRAEVSILEVPIETVYIEENQSSHFRVFRDSIAIYGLILKFLSSSILSFVLDWGLFTVLNAILAFMDPKWGILIATAGARIVSSLFNFFLNKKVVFRSGASTGLSLMRYYCVAVPILLAQLGLTHGAFLLFGIGEEQTLLRTVIYVIVMTVLYIVSFIIQQRWVFRPGAKERN